jgi:hypothetical protein
MRPDIGTCIFQCRNTVSDFFFNNKQFLLHIQTETSFVQVGGVLVMPLNDQLLQIVRTSETSWDVKSVLPVSFATLLLPEKTEVKDQIKLRKYVLFLAVYILFLIKVCCGIASGQMCMCKVLLRTTGLKTLLIVLFYNLLDFWTVSKVLNVSDCYMSLSVPFKFQSFIV